METFLIIAVLALVVIAAASALAPRLGVANPLLLVVLGIGVSLVPAVPDVHIEPEWILAGVLPPLLYSASVSMPTMDFRREFTAISGLSVVLVVGSAVVLGLFFSWVIPGLSLAWGIALGAIISPTDAVATSIVKRIGVSSRVVTMLEGESLLNDATALVLLRSAVAGAAASVSLWNVAGSFLYSVAIASVIGVVVGWANLAVRSRVEDSTVNTVISFTIPFIASVPAEMLGASGLVAAVVAGLVTGRGAIKRLSPSHRIAEEQNWKTIELVLEGAVFLLMGLELKAIVTDSIAGDNGFSPLLFAAGALAITLLVRMAYVGVLLLSSRRRTLRHADMRPRLDAVQKRVDARTADPEAFARKLAAGTSRGPGRDHRDGEQRRRQGPLPQGPRGPRSTRALERFNARLRRMGADIDYFLNKPFGWREGTVVVWAGMRGAVTLAAAQTLPGETPHRSMLILIAFIVAVGSLLLQGGTLGWVVHRVKPRTESPVEQIAERQRMLTHLSEVADAVPQASGAPGAPSRALAIIEAQREALLDARNDGTYSADSLTNALAVLDADQIRLEMRGEASSSHE
ncbi:cation:proton antiporter [Paramicrobacterium chengjingii]|uniref:Sodium:proton antiporter n=1 Tax=Paramicrobacterium chengjingii TaxID=2769067 RepID=A0ABX6YKY2_9MICO|nr:sodium:proton antiporter [Microbacterium chengjingii]QPZ39448.1 sodium:proton antiporter [Microbacterium chengjingii]